MLRAGAGAEEGVGWETSIKGQGQVEKQAEETHRQSTEQKELLMNLPNST